MRQLTAYGLTLFLAPTLSALPMFVIGFFTPAGAVWAFMEQVVVGALAIWVGTLIFDTLAVAIGWGMVLLLAIAFLLNDLRRWRASVSGANDDARTQLRAARDLARLLGGQVGVWSAGWILVGRAVLS